VIRSADGGGERGRGAHPERAVGAVGVVVLAPVLDQPLGFGQAGERLDAEQLAADAGAEALDVEVLLRPAGLDLGADGRPRP
jgi:hypothetical protein